jgi:hypothetical protein
MNRGEELVFAVKNAFSDLVNSRHENYKQLCFFDDASFRQYFYNTKLDPSILNMDGMSGMMFRNFINILLSQPQISSYMEIGCWTGSTAISAMYNNHNIKRHWLIDNWSEWGNNGQTEMAFHKNWNRFIKHTPPVVIDKDCFQISPKEHGLENVDVYFCDGGNDESNERNAYRSLSHFYDSMSDQFVFIIDDWFCRTPTGDVGEKLRNQTQQAISDLNLKVLFELGMPQQNNTMSINGSGDKYGWWNGCGIFVLSK